MLRLCLLSSCRLHSFAGVFTGGACVCAWARAVEGTAEAVKAVEMVEAGSEEDLPTRT